MRNMSFMLTSYQVRNRTKTVTRRIGWKKLTNRTLVQAVVKSRGLKKGEKVEKLAVIRVVSKCFEQLQSISPRDIISEGFQAMSRLEFIRMFCRSNRGCTPETVVTRIEFEYVDQ